MYYGNHEGRLEHDFVVAAGADPSQIEFDLSDQSRKPALIGSEFRLGTKAGEMTLRAPLAYQIIDGQRKEVEAAYEDVGSGHIRFRLGLYDRQHPLVIDPVLVYSAVFGGNNPNLERKPTKTARFCVVMSFSASSSFLRRIPMMEAKMRMPRSPFFTFRPIWFHA